MTDYPTPDARIRLAEFVGGDRWEAYINPSKHPECVSLPDPLNDHTDCHALIEALRDREKIAVQCDHLPPLAKPANVFFMRHDLDLFWLGDDYRVGVVTLALEVVP